MILLLRGPASVGKTTVGRLVGEKIPALARVDLEDLLRLLPEAAWDEARSALTLQNAATLARNFGAAGYDLLVEGVFGKPSDLDRFLADLGDLKGPVHLFTLTTPLAVLKKRNEARPPLERHTDSEVKASYELVRDGGESRGYFLDSRDLSPRETTTLLLEMKDRQKGRLR